MIRSRAWALATALIGLVAVAGCLAARPEPGLVTRTDAPLAMVHRVAIVVQDMTDQRSRVARAQIAGLAHEVLALRPDIQRVDRDTLDQIQREQALHASGQVSDDTAVRIGRLAGADGLLLITVAGPSLRDLVLAREPDHLDPVVVTARLIRVESGEVAWYTTVSAPIRPGSGWPWGDPWRAGAMREAMDRALEQLRSRLREATGVATR